MEHYEAAGTHKKRHHERLELSSALWCVPVPRGGCCTVFAGRKLLRELAEALTMVRRERAVRCLLIRSTVPNAFCAGADLKVLLPANSYTHSKRPLFPALALSPCASLSSAPYKLRRSTPWSVARDVFHKPACTTFLCFVPSFEHVLPSWLHEPGICMMQ